MDKIIKEVLDEIKELDMNYSAFNLRVNGKLVDRKSSDEIKIESKKDKSGIDIFITNNTQNKSLHIPVIITESGLSDLVYNDFYVGDNCNITIVAGCGIHNCGENSNSHNGIHSFHIGKNSNVRYIEKHIGLGNKESIKILNPTTKITLKQNSKMIMETTQVSGVSFANRKSNAILYKNAKLIIKEKILTTKDEIAKTNFLVTLKGENSSAEVVSRSVAKDNSSQNFESTLIGKNNCFGRVECDGILTDNAKIFSSPRIKAENVNSSLTHEAVIGKIAGEELIKLQTLGLSKQEAENEIINGFLK